MSRPNKKLKFSENSGFSSEFRMDQQLSTAWTAAKRRANNRKLREMLQFVKEYSKNFLSDNPEAVPLTRLNERRSYWKQLVDRRVEHAEFVLKHSNHIHRAVLCDELRMFRYEMEAEAKELARGVLELRREAILNIECKTVDSQDHFTFDWPQFRVVESTTSIASRTQSGKQYGVFAAELVPRYTFIRCFGVATDKLSMPLLQFITSHSGERIFLNPISNKDAQVIVDSTTNERRRANGLSITKYINWSDDINKINCEMRPNTNYFIMIRDIQPGEELLAKNGTEFKHHHDSRFILLDNSWNEDLANENVVNESIQVSDELRAEFFGESINSSRHNQSSTAANNSDDGEAELDLQPWN